MRIKIRIGMIIIAFLVFNPIHGNALNLGQSTNNRLTIYTYDSLFAFPEYDFVAAFETFAGLEEGSVQVVRFDDAGSIVTNAFLEKGDPIADVLIGLDNVLVHKARELEVLSAYQPSDISELKPDLIEGLASDFLLTPYDYGVISLWYLNNEITNLNTDDFQLTDLMQESLAATTIVQNPLLSSPGLGFLLWTIAVFGDESNGINGLVPGNWEGFWGQLVKNDVLITDSWGDAIDLLYTKEADRHAMVSYTSSPAFGACLDNDFSTTALLSNEGGLQRGWQQIEGLGIVNGAENRGLAEDFIDWFISQEVQSQVLQSQWVYPAIGGIELPECYNSSIHPDDIEALNTRLDQSTVEENLDDWLDRWEIAIIEEPDFDTVEIPTESSELDLEFNPFYVFLLATPILRTRRNKFCLKN